MIIGVIAAVTIPALRKSAEQRETIAGLKKAYSTICQLVEKSEIDNGSLKRWTMADTPAFYEEYIIPYMNISQNCGFNPCFGSDWKYFNGADWSAGNAYKFKLADGTGWLFSTDSKWFHIHADINGDKKPNKSGEDIFIFTVLRQANIGGYDNGDVPGVYLYGNGMDRTTLLNECLATGHTCGALIQMDGWKINY
jgi:hypothetical protein